MSKINMQTAAATAAPTYSQAVQLATPNFSYEVNLAGTGAISATVVLYWSNDGTNWKTLATFSLSGTNTATDGDHFNVTVGWIRSGITAISGTGAAVTDNVNVP
jgi:hypothetical protein